MMCACDSESVDAPSTQAREALMARKLLRAPTDVGRMREAGNARMWCAPARIACCLVALSLSACAATGGIGAQFVSADKFQELTCQQIGAEGERVARRVAEISGVEYAAPGATWLATQPIVVHWPTAWLATSDEGAPELPRLKGEFEALERASALKRCSYSFKQQTT
jgi:hypothetical protein